MILYIRFLDGFEAILDLEKISINEYVEYMTKNKNNIDFVEIKELKEAV